GWLGVVSEGRGSAAANAPPWGPALGEPIGKGPKGVNALMAHPGGHGGQEVEKASVDRARHPRTQIARAAENTGRPDRPQAQADRRSNPPKGSDVERIPQLAPGQAQNPEVTNCDRSD